MRAFKMFFKKAIMLKASCFILDYEGGNIINFILLHYRVKR